MQIVVQDTIQSDTLVADTLASIKSAVADLPARDSNLMSDMSQIFGSLSSKHSCFVDSVSDVASSVLPIDSVLLFLFVLISYVFIIKRYPREIVSIFKIIIFPTLFNKTHEVNSVHLKHYMSYAFIFSAFVLATLSWIYIANGDPIIPISVYLYISIKGGVPKLIGVRQGRKSPISKLTYFIISFHTTVVLILAPVVLASIVFGPLEFLYIFTIALLSSYYLFLARYFYKEKFSFKQFLLYLCTAEVVPLALVSCLFYTKIIAFGN